MAAAETTVPWTMEGTTSSTLREDLLTLTPGKEITEEVDVPSETEVDVPSETEVEDTITEWEAETGNGSLASQLGHGGLISVLFETPSGFAIFGYDGVKLLRPHATEHIWADFVKDYMARNAVWLKSFQIFENKANIITENGVTEKLSRMINDCTLSGQRLAVGSYKYKDVIEKNLEIPCLCDEAVMELMWGLKLQMKCFIPQEVSVIDDDCIPICKGMSTLLNLHNFNVKPEMMVNRQIIEWTGLVYECDRIVNKHSYSMRSVGEYLETVSSIECQHWDLLKLATALKIVCYPEEKVPVAKKLFSSEEHSKLLRDAHKYERLIFKGPLLRVYKEMLWARKLRYKAVPQLVALIKKADKEYDAGKRYEATSNARVR